MVTELLLSGIAITLLLKLKNRNKKQNGIGKLNYIILCSKAQKMGIPLYINYDELTKPQRDALTQLAREYGYKQTKTSFDKGKSYPQSFYSFLQSKYKSIRKVAGIGIINRIPTGGQYPVYDEEGNVIATYYDFIERASDKQLYMQALQQIADMGKRDLYEYGYWQTVKYIAGGGKFVWKDKKTEDGKRVLLKGVEGSLFASKGNHTQEKKNRRSMLGSEKRGAAYPEKFAEELAGYDGDSSIVLNGVLDAIRTCDSRTVAQAEIMQVWGRDFEFEQAEREFEYNKGYEQYARENNML